MIRKESLFQRPLGSAFLGGVLLLFSLSPSCGGGLKQENEELKKEAAELAAENDRLKGENSRLRTELSGLHSRLAELNRMISSLKIQNQSLQNGLDDLRDQRKGKKKK